MSKPIVDITVDPKGGVKVETRNVVGSGCRKLSERYENALGLASDEELKPEFYQNPEIKQKITV